MYDRSAYETGFLFGKRLESSWRTGLASSVVDVAFARLLLASLAGVAFSFDAWNLYRTINVRALDTLRKTDAWLSKNSLFEGEGFRHLTHTNSRPRPGQKS